MAEVTFKGVKVKTVGSLPKVGKKAADFLLTRGDLSDVSLKDFAGKKKILGIVHSLDTGTCAASAKRFEAEIAKLADTVVLTISNDLPFAQSRFCQAEGIKNVVTLSQMRNRRLGRDYVVEFVSGPIAGLTARAVVVLDENNMVRYTEQVQEATHEPNYEAALKAVQG
ncbi:MAG: thiol peroxidase [Spirochaetales bacterium]|nr:thiol peroxidase [Spirochaetales bacterium]